MVHMDQGSTINFDVEEKQINLGRNLFFQEMSKFNDEFSNCEQESVRDAIPDHSNDFKYLFNSRLKEIDNAVEQIQQRKP